MTIASRMGIAPSATLHMNSLALQKKQQGEKVYNLSAGEPMIDTPSIIIDAATKAMQEGKTHYSPVAGISELLDAFALWVQQQYGYQFSQKEICVTNGGKFALYALCQALLNPADEAIMLAPYWVSYSSMVELAGGKAIEIQTKEEQDWKVSIEQLDQAKSSKTKILFLNNAGNPTGALYSKEEIENMLRWASDNNILVVSDEVYSGLVYDNNTFVSVASFPEYKDYWIIVESCSKNFAMTGWRVGFLAGSEKIIQAVKTLQGQSTSNTSTISQWAAVSAYRHAQEIVPTICTQMQMRRNAFVDSWNRYIQKPLRIPEAGLYAFFPIETLGGTGNDVAFCTQLLEKGNIASVPGSAFGTPGYIRCSFGVQETEIHEAIQALAIYMHSLS